MSVFTFRIWPWAGVRGFLLGKVFFWSVLSSSPLSVAATLEQQRTLFLQAEQALDQGRPEDARRSLEGLDGYPLQPYLIYRILSGTPGTEGEIPAFLERYSRTRHAAPLRKKWLEYLAQREAWDDYVRNYRDTGDAQAQCHYYWALHRLGRSPEAFAGAAKLWAKGEPQPSACDRLFVAWQTTSGFTPEHLWKRFGLALGKNQLGLAMYLRNLVPGRDQGLAEFWFKVHDNPKLVEQCAQWNSRERVLGRIFAHGVDRLVAQEPLLAQSVWNLRRNEFELDKETTTRLDRRLALALATQRYPQAAAYLGAVPEDEADSQIRTWRVRSALWKQDWLGVLIALEQLDAAEKQQTAWRYWRARALEALGDAAAVEMYRSLAGERDFYGFIAADRLRQKYALSFDPIPVADADLQQLAMSESFRVVREFRDLNRPGEAQKEWTDAIQSLSPRDLVAAAKLAQQWGWDRLAILTLAKAERWDDLSLRFPLAYSQPVLQQAREQRLDPAVVYGLIRRESAFDAYAKSSAGALGLMQLLPSTGEQVARLLKERWPSERGLLEPDLNVRYGSTYFRRLMDRFGHHFALAAAAYNAGPGRVDRWLPAKTLPADIWIETIPFNETRQYVSAVLSYAVIYRERLGAPFVRISEFLTEVAPGGKADRKPDRPMPVPVCHSGVSASAVGRVAIKRPFAIGGV